MTDNNNKVENKYSSFTFIESGIVFNTKTSDDFAKHAFTGSDFVNHQQAYDFLLEFYDEHGEVPNSNIFIDKFPDLDGSAIDANLDFCIDIFKNQILTRKAYNIIKTEGQNLANEPQKTVSNIIDKLEKVSSAQNDDVYIYDSGNSTSRIQAFKERKRLRQNQNKLGIIGIPTPIRSVNNYGIGILPGEICSMIARPGVGKSWFSIKAATITVSQGYKTLFVTAEMPAEQMSLRFDVFMGNLMGYNFSHNALKTGSSSVDENLYMDYLNKNDNHNLIIVDHIGDYGLSIKGIHSLVRKYKPDVLVIDNMELLSGDGRGYRQTWEVMNHLYQELKHLCVANHLPAFITHQANRDASDPFKLPGKTEISSGDALLRNSDMVFSMCLSREDDKKRLIGFQKFRDMPEQISDDGYVVFKFDVDVGIFIEE